MDTKWFANFLYYSHHSFHRHGDGEAWTCTITCDDGLDAGNSITATAVGANAGDAVGGNLYTSAGEVCTQYNITGCLEMLASRW